MITMTQECFSSPWRGGSPIISLLRSQRPNPTFLEDGTTSTTTHSLIFLGRIITLKTTRLLARAAGWHSSQVLLCLEQPQEGFCPERHSSQQKGASDSEAMLPGSSQWGLVCARFSGSPWGQMQRSLAGYGPQGCKELDTTEATEHTKHPGFCSTWPGPCRI